MGVSAMKIKHVGSIILVALGLLIPFSAIAETLGEVGHERLEETKTPLINLLKSIPETRSDIVIERAEKAKEALDSFIEKLGVSETEAEEVVTPTLVEEPTEATEMEVEPAEPIVTDTTEDVEAPVEMEFEAEPDFEEVEKKELIEDKEMAEMEAEGMVTDTLAMKELELPTQDLDAGPTEMDVEYEGVEPPEEPTEEVTSEEAPEMKAEELELPTQDEGEEELAEEIDTDMEAEELELPTQDEEVETEA